MADCRETADDTAAGSSGDVADEAPTVEKLQEKIAFLEAEQQKQFKDFGTQRAKYKELYHQKEEELESFRAENKKLLSELEEVKNELFALELQRTSYESEKRKCDDEIASLQKIVNDTVEENQNIRDELDRIQETCVKLESENNELQRVISEDKERSSDPLPIQKFTQVTKSIARKVMSELGADSSVNPPKDSLDDDMRKVNKYAHEDAEVLRSLMIPLEAEIQSLKEKLRDADQRLRQYEEERKPNEDANVQQGAVQEGKSGKSIGEASALSKSSLEEPLIQLSPSSPMEPSVPQPVIEAKPSPQENKDLEAFFGSGDDSIVQTTDVPRCETCQLFETDLAKAQQQLSEVQKALENSERAVQRAREDLNRERSCRQELETKWSAIKDQYDEQVANLKKMLLKSEQNLEDLRQSYERTKNFTDKQLHKLQEKNEEVREEIKRIQHKNDALIGKHLSKARQLQDLTIDLPGTVSELHELLLSRGEELITAKISAETHEEEVVLLRTQLSEFQKQYEELQRIELNRRMEFAQVEKKAEEYSMMVREQDEYRKKLAAEKEGLERQLLDERNKRRKLENDIQEYQRQVQSLQKDLTNSEHVQKDFVRLSQNLQKQLEVLRCEGAEVRWEHDDDVDQCPTCKSAFNHINRKKVHCRHCGHIFCNSCLNFVVNSGPRLRPSRVCEVCHTLLMPDTAPYFSTDPPSAPD